jgi:hypothetical protein
MPFNYPVTVIVNILRALATVVLYPLARFGNRYTISVVLLGLAIEGWRSLKRHGGRIRLFASLAFCLIAASTFGLATMALLYHIVVVKLRMSSAAHAADTLSLLLSSGLLETFGLPGPFQLAFTSPNAPVIAYDPFAVIAGISVCVIVATALIGLLRSGGGQYWSPFLWATILVAVMSFNCLADHSEGASMLTANLLANAVLCLATFNIRAALAMRQTQPL